MEVPIYSIKGKASKKSAKLPDAFSEPVRLDLIRKAVRASRANRRQPYGASNGAGFRHSVSWPGKGRGMARTPRKNGGGGRGAQAPNTIGGRRAHPPKAEKDWTLKINSKDLVSYAYSKKVMIVSPMSLFPMLQITVKALHNMKVERSIDDIQKNIGKLADIRKSVKIKTTTTKPRPTRMYW